MQLPAIGFAVLTEEPCQKLVTKTFTADKTDAFDTSEVLISNKLLEMRRS